VPKGIRPPVPEPIKPEDTDVLIAALGAELIDEPEPEPEAEREPSGSVAAVDTSFPEAPVAAAAALGGRPQRTPWTWIGIGGLAAAFVLGIALTWGDDEATKAADESPAAYSASMSAKPGNDSGETRKKAVAPREPVVAEVRPDPEPQPGAIEPAAIAPEAVEPEPEAELEEAEPEPEAELEEAEPEPEAELEAPPDPTPEPEHQAHGGKRRHSKTKRRDRDKGTPPAASVSSSSPATSPKPGSGSTAEDLLSQAEKALQSGKNSTAYVLASRSRSKKGTTKALQIMAKAACRMGSANKAKYAFDKLSLGARAGIRGECRKKGVKLGI
jgi:hypothetical protein